MIPKHIFWPIIDCYSMYGSLHAEKHSRCCFTQIVAESVGVVTSPHVTKTAVTSFDPLFLKTPCYANFTTPSFIDPELLPIEVLHCANTEFCIFCEK